MYVQIVLNMNTLDYLLLVHCKNYCNFLEGMDLAGTCTSVSRNRFCLVSTSYAAIFLYGLTLPFFVLH